MDLNIVSTHKAPSPVTADSFEREVLEASVNIPVIVDFWAPWCGPCRQMMPALEKVVAGASGAVRLVTVDIDKNPELAQVFRVQSVPTVYAFFRGQPVDGFSGSKPESELKAFVAKLAALGGGVQEGEPAVDAEGAKRLIAEGDALFRDGKTEPAMEKYALALDADPSAAAALGAVGWCLLAQGDLVSVRGMAADFTPEHKSDPRVKGLLFVVEMADTAPEETGLEARLAQNAQDHAARYGLALQMIAVADLAGAAESLVELTRRDRDWSEQKARKLLLDLFEAMGPHHPVTVRGRRALSAVLFS